MLQLGRTMPLCLRLDPGLCVAFLWQLAPLMVVRASASSGWTDAIFFSHAVRVLTVLIVVLAQLPDFIMGTVRGRPPLCSGPSCTPFSAASSRGNALCSGDMPGHNSPRDVLQTSCPLQWALWAASLHQLPAFALWDCRRG